MRKKWGGSLEDVQPLEFAYCWRSGVVEFGKELPAGAIAITRGAGIVWREWVAIKCRLAYDGKTLLVPGIPEAEDDEAAFTALKKFCDWIEKCNTKRNANMAHG